MPNIIIPFILSTFAGLSTLIGSILIFFKINEKKYDNFICFCLSFSLSIMIGISIFDLIPESFIICVWTYGFSKTSLILIISFIISFIAITLINKLMDREGIKEDLYKLGILNMIVLIVHNLPEGIATFLSSYKDITLGIKLSIAIMLHNIPEGISIAIPIYYSTKNKFKALKATLISGIAEPLGALIAFLFLKNYVSELMISIVLIVVAGLMITLSIQELFPKALKYNNKKMLYLGIIIGFILIIINTYLF